jgi:hypothetical protein
VIPRTPAPKSGLGRARSGALASGAAAARPAAAVRRDAAACAVPSSARTARRSPPATACSRRRRPGRWRIVESVRLERSRGALMSARREHASPHAAPLAHRRTRYLLGDGRTSRVTAFPWPPALCSRH